MYSQKVNTPQAKMTGYVRVGHWFKVGPDNQAFGICTNGNCKVDAYEAIIDRNCTGGKVQFEDGKPCATKSIYQTSDGKTVLEITDKEKKQFEEFLKQRKDVESGRRTARDDEEEEGFFGRNKK